MDVDPDYSLYHAGVKGMKWGVRKDRKTKPNKPGKRKYDPMKLNNQELKKVVARMRLEQEYLSLNKKQTSKGKKFAQGLLQDFGKKRAQQVTEIAFAAALGAAIPKLAKEAPKAAKYLSLLAASKK